MMKISTTTLKLASMAALLSASSWMVGCSGDDGAVGPAGTDGTNGTNGTNGLGFDEALKRGNVVFYLEGTRPDNVAFKDTIDFRFAPSDLEYSSLYRGNAGTDTDNEVTVARFSNWDGSGTGWDGATNTTYTYTEKQYNDSKVLTYEDYYFELDDVTISFPKDNKYFVFNFYGYVENYYDETGTLSDTYNNNIDNLAVTNYKETIGTDGAFGYKASFTVAAENNSTGYDLKITVVSNVKVVEQIQNNNEGGRMAAKAKANAHVEKAQMLPIN